MNEPTAVAPNESTPGPGPGVPASSLGIAAGLVSELRSPLSRIELAVSQLQRNLASPGGRELAASISEAVREADRGVGRVLHLLEPNLRSARRSELGEVLARLHGRVGPALKARGITLELGEPIAADSLGDARLVEQAALALIRVGSSLVVSEARFDLGLTVSENQLTLNLRGQSVEGDYSSKVPARVFASLRPWVARHGGEVSGEGTHASWQASISLPGVRG